MPKDISQAVREICLWFPEATEVTSHGMSDFRVRGKTFATYAINHHGDGRIALWLNSPAGAQHEHVSSEPKQFFIPPYVGPRGWLGVNLAKGISWKAVARLVRDAYEKVAPPALARSSEQRHLVREASAFPRKADRRQRALADDDRVHELDRNVARIRARRRRATERDQAAAAGEALGHPVTHAREPVGLRVEEVAIRACPVTKSALDDVSSQRSRHTRTSG
jgi:hypothetical protein